MADTCCILVNYKNTDDTIEALESLESLVAEDKLSVVVVDNESSEESFSSLSSFAKYSIEVIRSDENLGFAGGVNLGAKFAIEKGFKFLWLLNNDCVVGVGKILTSHAPQDDGAGLDPLTPMLETASRMEVGIVGSLITYYPDTKRIWYCGGLLAWVFVKHLKKHSDVSSVQGLKPFDTSFITGCSMLIPASVWNQVGGFDDELFLYAEDVDLCCKVKAKGYRLIVDPRSVIHHKVSRASGGEFNSLREYYNTRNSFEMIHRHINFLPLRVVLYFLRGPFDVYRITKSLIKSGDNPLKALGLFTEAFSDFFSGNLGKRKGERPL